MNIISSYEEILSSGNEYESNGNERNSTNEVISSNDTDLPLFKRRVSNDDDPVEEFLSDHDDAFSEASDFSNKESIHVFSQSQKSTKPTDAEYIYTTQEELAEENFEFPQKPMDRKIQYIYPTQEENFKLEEDFEFRGKPKDDTFDAHTVEIIGPESFLSSQKSSSLSQSQRAENILDSALSIIKHELEEFSQWQKDVDWKINKFGSVINAYHNDESVLILRVGKSWVENSLVFARCSVLEKGQVDTMIQTNTQGTYRSFSTESDMVQDFPEPLLPPPVPSINDTEADVLFIFSFAMNPNCSIEAMKECKVVAVWEPTFDVNDISLPDYPDTTSVSTITRFKIVA